MKLNYLKFYRLSKGFSMAEISEKVGISYAKYHAIEHGSQTASSDVAEKIAELLKVSPEKIFFAAKYTIREMEGDVI